MLSANNSYLIEKLSGLSVKEFNKLGEFLNSPFHNKSVRIIRLYNFLSELFPFPDNFSVSKKSLFSHIYPGKPFSDLILRKLIFDFNSLVDEFIQIYFGNKNEFRKNNELLAFFRMRKMNKNYNHSVKKFSDRFEKAEMKNIEFYHEKKFFHKEIYNHKTDNLGFSLNGYSDIIENSQYEFVLNYIQIYYSYVKFKNSFDRNAFLNLPFIKEVINFIQKNLDEIKINHPILFCEFLALKTIQEPDNNKNAEEIRIYLYENEFKLDVLTLKYMMLVLYNYYVGRLNKGFEEFRKPLFDLINEIDNKNLAEGVYSSFDLFLFTAVGNAIILKEFDKGEYLLEKYKHLLPASQRDHIYRINLANIKFFKGDSDSAYSLLNSVKFSNPLHYLFANSVLIKIYFEKGYWDSLNALMETVKKFLQRKNNLSDYHINVYLNLIKYLNEYLKFKDDRQGLNELYKTLSDEKICNSKKWLLEIIENKLSKLNFPA
ncbi:MAG TPA: hypothetical protein PLG90_08495 [Ignavibacteria bacterium]|nr:hypothetical protein [Ignavibacteria bacterium]